MEGASLGPGLPPPSPGTWPAVRAAFSGPRPRVTCPESPWKPALRPSLLPSSPHRPRIRDPRPCHSTSERGGATLLVHSPRLSLPRERAGLSWRRVPGGGDAEARRRLPGCGGGRRGDSPPSPRPLPSPAPPPRPRAAQCSARRRVRHKQTQLGHTWTAEQLRPATDPGLRTPGLRKPKPPGRPGECTELRLGPGHLAPLPLHGSAAAAAAAALAFRGSSRQRVQALR